MKNVFETWGKVFSEHFEGLLNVYFQKEKKILETKRLDLDSSKSRLRKAKSVASQTQVSIPQLLLHVC